MQKNIYAIGDIHGMLDNLKELLDNISPTDKDTLVFLGDYYDRGPDSFELINFLIELNKKLDCIFLQGNHEDMFREYLAGNNEQMYLYNGGDKTIESYKQNGFNLSDSLELKDRAIPKEHGKFLDNLFMLYETADYIFVHAGIKLIYEDDTYKYADSSKQNEDYLLWDREFHRFGRCVYKGPKTVIFGHTPWSTVRFTDYAVCIDTGCGYRDGFLSCIRLPEKKLIQTK